MALPNFDAVKEYLARSKRDDQSWGNLFKIICNGTTIPVEENDESAGILSIKPSLIKVLAEWDFYSSQFLDEAASEYSVKSWQVTEYIEGLREALSIEEPDLIIYENQNTTEVEPTPERNEPESIEISLAQVGAEQDSIDDNNIAETNYTIPLTPSSQAEKSLGTSTVVLGLTGLVSALTVIVVMLIANINNQKTASSPSSSSMPSAAGQSEPNSGTPASQGDLPSPANHQVYFTGIDLPVTNTLCNKKRTFCIYDLANLVKSESGEAKYTFSDTVNGQTISINGTITVSNIERNGNNRSFTFAFRDDQSNTTPGWAAAGYFKLDQDPNPAKPGILTRFKTTESFGPKTPVGLENTSYLFPS
jgi:hypothetical protein